MAIFRPISWGRLAGLAVACTALFATPSPEDDPVGFRLGYFTGCFVLCGAVTALTAKRELS